MKKIGRVIEVFLPTDDELTKIGFKIKIDNQIISIIQPQNIENTKIYRNDFVFLKTINQNNQITYNIELISEKNVDLGDEDE